MSGAKRLLIIIGFFILFTSPVLAYLDPGTGTMFLQLLLAGVAGILPALKIYWRKLLAILRGEKEEKKDPESKGD